MRLFVFIPLAMFLLLAACGDSSGESERVLHLGGGDKTEAEARLTIRAWLMHTDGESYCRSLHGLSAEELSETIVKYQEAAGITPAQEPNPDDRIRLGAILKEECERILDSSP